MQRVARGRVLVNTRGVLTKRGYIGEALIDCLISEHFLRGLSRTLSKQDSLDRTADVTTRGSA